MPGFRFADHEAFSIFAFDVVYHHFIRETFYLFLDQHAHAINIERFFIFLRLIQSQSHIGAASAHALDVQAQVFAIAVFEYCLYLFFCRIRYL
jgi:hypothetical protein